MAANVTTRLRRTPIKDIHKRYYVAGIPPNIPNAIYCCIFFYLSSQPIRFCLLIDPTSGHRLLLEPDRVIKCVRIPRRQHALIRIGLIICIVSCHAVRCMIIDMAVRATAVRVLIDRNP